MAHWITSITVHMLQIFFNRINFSYIVRCLNENVCFSLAPSQSLSRTSSCTIIFCSEIFSWVDMARTAWIVESILHLTHEQIWWCDWRHSVESTAFRNKSQRTHNDRTISSDTSPYISSQHQHFTIQWINKYKKAQRNEIERKPKNKRRNEKRTSHD